MAIDQSLVSNLNSTCLDMLGDANIVIDGVETDAVFHNGYNELGLGVGMESSSPRLELLSSDAMSISKDTNIIVSGVQYKAVMPLQPDGDGMTMVTLEEVVV